jgi:hypothetical protein
MSGVKVGRAKNVNVRSGGGFAMPVSLSGGGVGILVIAVLAATHQRATAAVFHGIVWGLAMIGAAVLAYGVWWFRNRFAGPAPAPVCACQQHAVPQQEVRPGGVLPLDPAARTALPPVTNNFYGEQAAAAAIEAMRYARPQD